MLEARFEMVAGILLVALVALLPFEPQAGFLSLSILQWLFGLLLLASLPRLWHCRRELTGTKVVIAAAGLLAVYVLSSIASGEYSENSAKAILRMGAGLALLTIALTSPYRQPVFLAWTFAAVAAAVYGISDFLGFGFPDWFRTGDYYVGTVTRLSGSFEYPNVAAAYFALSLPFVWELPPWGWFRITGATFVWLALVLTFSRGAVVALLGMFAIAWILRRKRAPHGHRPPRISGGSLVWLALLGALAYLSLSFFEPLLLDRLRPGVSRETVDAIYEPAFNLARLEPDAEYTLPVRIRNTGVSRWDSAGPRQVTLSYYWYEVARAVIVDTEAFRTPLPNDVKSGEAVEVTARIRTPDRAGLHLMDLELRQEGFGWFSTTGVYPGIVEVRLRPGTGEEWVSGDVSRWYQTGSEHVPSLDSSVSRSELWRAALAIAEERPLLGAGPDNYRLLYGNYLGYERWDDNVRSNNTFLELLATVGIVGLAAFGFVVVSAKYTWRPASLALGVFLLHGLVDVFLMTTSIYFGFWLLLGFADENRI